MSHGKQFTLYTHVAGTNGWYGSLTYPSYTQPSYSLRSKVVFVLEELGLTYESKYLNLDEDEQKSPEHVALHPNGRIPTLIDHANNDFVVWYECSACF